MASAGGGGGEGVVADSGKQPVLSVAELEKVQAVENRISEDEKACRDALYRVMLRNVEEKMHHTNSDFNKYLMPSTMLVSKDFFGPVSDLGDDSSTSALMYEACKSGFVCDLLCSFDDSSFDEESGPGADPLLHAYEMVEQIVRDKIEKEKKAQQEMVEQIAKEKREKEKKAQEELQRKEKIAAEAKAAADEAAADKAKKEQQAQLQLKATKGELETAEAPAAQNTELFAASVDDVMASLDDVNDHFDDQEESL